MSYRWPAKIAKFGIRDPFAKVLVVKYENEIPWQSIVRDEATLVEFVSQEMLPRCRQRITLPIEGGVKHCFVSPKGVDFARSLEDRHMLDDTDADILRLIRDEDGMEEATIALAHVVNARKAAAFREWIDLLEGRFGKQPAFHLLVLRPLLEMSGTRSRRAVIPPSADILEWLHGRIKTGVFQPGDNVAKVYLMKAAAGAGRVSPNGWQHIPRGSINAARLAAACAGSGWCVADRGFANNYLERSEFYLLRAERKPVVALRVSGGGNVVECQGRYNESPDKWFADIDLFVRSMNLRLCDRAAESAHALKYLADPDKRSAGWWSERARYWPFALRFAPPDRRPSVKPVEVSDLASYVTFPTFERLLAESCLSIDRTALVEANPTSYDDLSPTLQADTGIVRACLRGWMERVRNGLVTYEEMRRFPAFVKEDPEFRKAVGERVFTDFQPMLRRQPRTAVERRHRPDLDTLVPPTLDEPAALASERMVVKLLGNMTPDYSDALFTEVTRERADFDELRRDAWAQAMDVHPPMWFSLPEDLAEEPAFAPDDGEVTRVDLEAWVAKVRSTPWLLTQQKGVPKSVRHHRRILEAYFEGWMIRLETTPWCIWVKRGRCGRVYMSYALIGSPRFVEALTACWYARRRTLHTSWCRASLRMRRMPRFQVAVLRSVGDIRARVMTRQQLDTFYAIADMQTDETEPEGVDALYVAEVRERLARARLWFWASTRRESAEGGARG